MKNLPEAPDSVEAPLNGPQWQLVQRIAKSRQFEKSARMREFLFYICDRFLHGRPSDINEQLIGHRVFGRRVDYNPSDDNIVRVEARNLRKRLEDYFANEGNKEPVVVLVPRGGYVPVFQERSLAAIAPAVEAPPAVLPAGVQVSPTGVKRTAAIPILSFALLLVAAACVGLWVQNQRLQKTDGSAQRPAIWKQLFTRDRPTFVVIADSALALMQDVTGASVTLDDYINGKFPARLAQARENSEIDRIVATLARRQYTSIADAYLSSRILQQNPEFADRTGVRFARNLGIRDFNNNNVILLGSARANPWVELFDKHLNFRIEYDPQTRLPFFRNKSPGSGEQPAYRNGGLDGKSVESYGVVAFVPNLNRTGSVLIIAGTNMEGTEAAGELLINEQLCAELLKKIGVAGLDPIPSFEVLLKLRAVGGAARDTEPISFRLPKI